jgi:hypothetical protein
LPGDRRAVLRHVGALPDASGVDRIRIVRGHDSEELPAELVARHIRAWSARSHATATACHQGRESRAGRPTRRR